MIHKEDIITTAYTWIGTPWQHHQRVKGLDGGVDCVQFLAGVAEELGIEIGAIANYYRIPQGDSLLIELRKYLPEKNINHFLPGDVACFRIGGIPHHVGIITEKGFIHASQSLGKVCEQELSSRWIKRIVGVFNLVGLNNG